MTTQDAKLIADFLAGEREAMSTIEDWIAKASFPYKRRLGHIWEDVSQSARLEITRLLQSGTFRGESSLKTYLWRVVNTTCLTFIRKQMRSETVDIDLVFEKPDEKAISPADAVVQKEKEMIAMRVWAGMPADCRELWQMILRGLSYDEMSTAKQINSGTLRVRVLRCREKAVAARERLIAKT